METRVLAVNAGSLALAKSILERGGLVAFPTETVYGLGGDARSDEAVRAIYAVKGRPQDNPLIVHVSKSYDVGRLVKRVRPYAADLARAYLPGPLTMVYESRGTVSPLVSCGLGTVAVRVPSSEAAEAFLAAADMPVAAPSANVSKHVSPTSARHVYDDLAGAIPLILDGGASAGGIESTVLDVTSPLPVILRAGLVTAEMIAEIAGDCAYSKHLPGEKIMSPGVKYKHYSPACETALFSPERISDAIALYDGAERAGRRVAFVAPESARAAIGSRRLLSLGASAETAATALYAALREGERTADLLIGVRIPAKGAGVGVMNRMEKAFGAEEKA